MPQNKKTEPQQELEEIPELTHQQQKFVEGILAGRTASDAYRAAYDCSNMQQRTIWAESSRLRANPAVTAWLSAARKAGMGSAVLTHESHLRELERIREIALESGNIGAAVQAETARGKASGHYVEQVRDVTDRHDPVQTLREIAQQSPELAASLAAQNGIDFDPHAGVTKH